MMISQLMVFYGWSVVGLYFADQCCVWPVKMEAKVMITLRNLLVSQQLVLLKLAAPFQ